MSSAGEGGWPGLATRVKQPFAHILPVADRDTKGLQLIREPQAEAVRDNGGGQVLNLYLLP